MPAARTSHRPNFTHAEPLTAALPRFHPRRRFRRAPPPGPARRLAAFLAFILLAGLVILLPGARLSSFPRSRPLSAQSIPPDAPPPRPPVSAGGAAAALPDHPVNPAASAFADPGQAPDPDPPEAPAAPAPPLSAVVLFHNEYATLNHTLQSWEDYSLPSHVSEVLFFLNGVKSADDFTSRLPRLERPPWLGLARVVPSPKNLKLGLAITQMVRLASADTVLLLEKDWALIEPEAVVGATLSAAKRLLDEGAAHVVRFRHRDRPGAPLHARIMHENREPQMLAQQSNLYCYLHHWVKDPIARYPEYFSRCSNRTEDAVTWCAKARYCQWTNNPGMFKKDWFLRELGDKYTAMYNQTIKENPHSGMLDFEFYTNWRNDVWNGRDFVVALPKGLFEHQEVGEQNLMNTVWYAWNRLNTDAEEKMRALLATERKECVLANKTLSSGPKYKDKFPIDFVRLYHYNRAMNRTVEDAVAELEETSLTLRKRLEDGHGTWRHGVTDLTNLWYKVILYAYPEEPEDMEIAFVTALFRTDGDEGGEPSAEQVEQTCANLNILQFYNLIVYTSAETKIRIENTLKEKYGWDNNKLQKVEFAVRSLDDMLHALLGVENVERVKKLHAQEDWEAQVRARNDNKVPSVPSLCLSMAKPYVLHDAMQRGLSNDDAHVSKSTHYVWFEATSRCIASVGNSTKLSSNNDHVLRANLLMHVLASGVRVENVNEVEAALAGSGFSRKALLREMQVSDESLEDGVSIADLKTLGGSRLAVTLLKGYYDVVLRNMLRLGELGTGREALSIAHKNVRYNFKLFDGAKACRAGDDNCVPEALDEGYMQEDARQGCALFRWAGSCAGSGG